MENKIEKTDELRKLYPTQEFYLCDSLNLVAVLTSFNIYPVALVEQDRYKAYITTCVYKRDDEMLLDLLERWNHTSEFDDMKLVFKCFSRIKKGFKNKNVNDFKGYQ